MDVKKSLGVLLALFSLVSGQACGFTVFDPTNLAENITMRILSLQQWSEDNQTQISQLSKLQSQYDLDKKNFEMPNLNQWSKINTVNEDTLTLVSAAGDLWTEFGDLNRYLASFKKAEAWESCFKSERCTFNTLLRELDSSAIGSAAVAVQNAAAMQYKLKRQAQELTYLIKQAEQSGGQASTLDTLSKINASTSMSLMDLNTQISSLLELFSHQVMQTANERVANSKAGESFYSGAANPTFTHFDIDFTAEFGG